MLIVFQQGGKLPENSSEFGRDWRRQCKSDMDKYNFLLRIGGEELGKIFRVEIIEGLLGDMITALCSQFQADHVEDIVVILDRLSQVNRFSLSVQFLSTKEKETCTSLFQKIDKTFTEKNCTDNTWKRLVGLYGIQL